MKTSSVEPRMECEERLQELWLQTGHENLRRLSEGGQPRGMIRLRTDWDRKNAISSCLMAAYQDTGNVAAFDLLVELNRAGLLWAIRNRLRRGFVYVDENDALQHALMNMCRYRKSYRCERPDSFRVWSQRIANNSAARLLKGETKRATPTNLDTIGPELVDHHSRSPYLAAAEAESAQLVNLAYLTYLNVYLRVYQQVSERERRALFLVEVKGKIYKQTAAALGIRVDALKTVIFRARRKIYRGVDRYLGDLCQPVAAG